MQQLVRRLDSEEVVTAEVLALQEIANVIVTAILSEQSAHLHMHNFRTTWTNLILLNHNLNPQRTAHILLQILLKLQNSFGVPYLLPALVRVKFVLQESICLVKISTIDLFSNLLSTGNPDDNSFCD